MQRLRPAVFFIVVLALSSCETPLGQSWNNAVSKLSNKPADDSDTRNGLNANRGNNPARDDSGTAFLGPKPQTRESSQPVSSGPVRLKPFRESTRSSAPKPTPKVFVQGVPSTTPKPSPRPSPKKEPAPETIESVADTPEPAPKSTPEASNELPPFASRGPGKKGYVTSPYSPAAGFIDVTGLEPGSSAKDPYSGKVFRVP